jgi:thioredoxin 2
MTDMLSFSEGKIQLDCPACKQKNAVPAQRVQEHPACGSCKADLNIDRPVRLTDASFDSLIQNAKVPVLVDFWATWCGPCQRLGPVLDRFAAKHSCKVIIAKISTEECQEIPERFGVQGIPTLILFRDGKEHKRQVGLVPEQVLDEMLKP